MLRITETLKGSVVTLKVDARLVSGDTEVLLQACQPHSAALVVDPSDLHFADDAGICVLQALKAQGARVVGARPYPLAAVAEPDGPIEGSW